jgi:hypothetical protein
LILTEGQKQTLQKIQIWSNANGSEFAIRLDTDIEGSFRAVTKQKEKYVKIVEETEYMHDMKYEWNYTLKYWVDTRVNGRFNATRERDNILTSDYTTNDAYENSIISRNSINNDVLRTDEKFSDSALFGSELSSASKKEPRTYKRKRSAQSKARLKCHYCGLKFPNEMGRASHEKEWHAVCK